MATKRKTTVTPVPLPVPVEVAPPPILELAEHFIADGHAADVAEDLAHEVLDIVIEWLAVGVEKTARALAADLEAALTPDPARIRMRAAQARRRGHPKIADRREARADRADARQG